MCCWCYHSRAAAMKRLLTCALACLVASTANAKPLWTDGDRARGFGACTRSYLAPFYTEDVQRRRGDLADTGRSSRHLRSTSARANSFSLTTV